MKINSKKLGLIIVGLAGAALLVGIVIIIISGITKKNPQGTLGNSAGNLYNRGLFCEYEGLIYFSNPDDDGALYVMNKDCTNLKKVYGDKVRYINTDQNYIYYARVNNLKPGNTLSLYSTGLFRINRIGNPHLKTLSKEPCAALLLYENTIYFQRYEKSKGLHLYSVSISGAGEKKLFDEGIYPASIANGSLIYSGIDEDRDLHRMDLNTLALDTVYPGYTYFPIAVDDGVYYMDVSNYHICFTSYTGDTKELVAKTCCTYNISMDGRYLYYQTDRHETNYIGVLDLVTGEDTLILEGNFKEINVTSDYVFFRDFSDSETYAYKTDGSGQLSLFKPGKAR